MSEFLYEPPAHLHLVGIGGTGMSAIARVLHQQGYQISGSDRSATSMTDALTREGITVYIGHDVANIAGAQALIVTSAAQRDNPEIAAAELAAIPIFKRSQMIGALTRHKRVIAVAGTHGKTTTTGLVTHILLTQGRNPSFIVGSTLNNPATNAAHGIGDDFVIEADEYDHMFLGLAPTTAIVTNVEWDHPDFFTTAEAFTDAFSQFASRIVAGGVLIACADDVGARALARERTMNGGRVITYGLAADAEYRLSNLSDDGAGVVFTLHTPEGAELPVQLTLSGAHNALNATAALIACALHGVPIQSAIRSLLSFNGTGRRFEVRADVNGIAVIDDYAHHPTAIRVTLAAARARYPNRTIWAVWQPHTFSRTQTLIADYATAFSNADHVIVTPIYAAREQQVDGVTGFWAAAQIAHHHREVTPAESLAGVVDVLRRGVRAPAAILIFSAGDAPQIGIDFLKSIT